jgi:transposase
LPITRTVYTGDLDAELLVTSQRKYSMDLIGSMRADGQWPAHAAQGVDASYFQIDWEQQRATSLGGYTSLSWTPAVEDRTNEVVEFKFSMKDCQPYVSRVHCTRTKRPTITVRRRITTWHCKASRPDAQVLRARCPKGAGAIRAYGLRYARYIEDAKTHRQQVLTAAAINFVRIGN